MKILIVTGGALAALLVVNTLASFEVTRELRRLNNNYEALEGNLNRLGIAL